MKSTFEFYCLTMANDQLLDIYMEIIQSLQLPIILFRNLFYVCVICFINFWPLEPLSECNCTFVNRSGEACSPFIKSRSTDIHLVHNICYHGQELNFANWIHFYIILINVTSNTYKQDADICLELISKFILIYLLN